MTGRNLIENGDFSAGTSGWLTFDQPVGTGMVSSVNAGVFEFYRTATGTQAVVFQQTGMPVPNGARLHARFHVGNTDTVRKRISVLIHEAETFADLQVCTFWLAPNTPIHEYTMTASPTQDMKNVAISFYAASTGGGGVYQLDNVQMSTTGTVSESTACVDTAVPAPGGTAGSDMILNGSFSSGSAFWSPYGQIDGSFTGVEYRFTKLDGLPTGVLLQSTGQPLTSGQGVQLQFQLGLLAGVRGRVTVLAHDASFGDLAACTFWLDPKNAKRHFTMYFHATQPWTNATLSVYPASVLPGQVFQLDEVVMQPITGAPGGGTGCTAGAYVP